MRRFSLAALLALQALSCLVQAEHALAADEAGTWRGTANQPGHGSYEVLMELDGRGGGRTDYPSLSCGGNLSGGPGNYFESITYGRAVPGGADGCIDGSIAVAVSGETMFWSWSGSWEGESVSASATLQRVGGGADTSRCDTCGRALSSDVAAGLSSSALLRSYVQQSLGKYANCTRGETGQCANDCWRMNLANLLPNCETFDDAGHRACVNQTVSGANLSCQ